MPSGCHFIVCWIDLHGLIREIWTVNGVHHFWTRLISESGIVFDTFCLDKGSPTSGCWAIFEFYNLSAVFSLIHRITVGTV
jgi:hypothetical protein